MESLAENNEYKEKKIKEKQLGDLIQQGKIEEAEKIAKELLESEPENLYVRGQLIRIYKLQQKWDSFERAANERLELEPNNLMVRMQLILTYVKQGKLDEAEKIVNEILEIDPNNIYAKSQLVTISIRRKNTKRAEEVSNEILEYDTDNLYARYQLMQLFKKQKRWDDIERIAGEILVIKPEDMYTRMQLISIYQKRKKWEEIEALAKESLSFSPNNEGMLNHLLVSYKKQGKVEEAEKIKKQISDRNKSSVKHEPKKIHVVREKHNHSAQITQAQKTVSSKNVQFYRRKIYDGSIDISNLEEFKENISELTEFEQKMLLAEFYTHFNIPKKATDLLKEAMNQEGISEKERSTLFQALQIAKVSKKPDIQRKIQWSRLGEEKE